MSSVGDQIRMDWLLNAIKGKDISNCTIIFGTCKDCEKNKGLCLKFLKEVEDDFCCKDFEKRGNENG